MSDAAPAEMGNEDTGFLALLEQARSSTEDAHEWFGEPHTLIVHEVTPPDGPFDDGDLGDYDLEHPPSCKQEEVDYGGDAVRVLVYTCEVASNEGDCGLAYSLRYSGTPITEPGTYRIQGWGRKIWTECGDEYDGGVGVMEPEGAEA